MSAQRLFIITLQFELCAAVLKGFKSRVRTGDVAFYGSVLWSVGDKQKNFHRKNFGKDNTFIQMQGQQTN